MSPSTGRRCWPRGCRACAPSRRWAATISIAGCASMLSSRKRPELMGPIILVAHSGGVIATVHWARQTRCAVRGALLATRADFEEPLPDGYPSMKALGRRLAAGAARPVAVSRHRSGQPQRSARAATSAFLLLRGLGEAGWSIWARSAISIPLPVLAIGRRPTPSLTSSMQQEQAARRSSVSKLRRFVCRARVGFLSIDNKQRKRHGLACRKCA